MLERGETENLNLAHACSKVSKTPSLDNKCQAWMEVLTYPIAVIITDVKKFYSTWVHFVKLFMVVIYERS
jgi:hypothetical protein